MRFSQITHYSAHAGCTHFIGREEVSPRLFEMCLPTMTTGQHLLPIDGYRIVVTNYRSDQGWLEGAHGVLLHDARLVAVLTLAMSDEISESLWNQFESYYLGATDGGHLARADWPVPKRPKVAPWVASFPLVTTALERRFLMEFIEAWGVTFLNVAVDEMTRCAQGRLG
jgi:hypothetical protein